MGSGHQHSQPDPAAPAEPQHPPRMALGPAREQGTDTAKARVKGNKQFSIICAWHKCDLSLITLPNLKNDREKLTHLLGSISQLSENSYPALYLGFLGF